MKNKKKKSREEKIQEAVTALNKAMAMEEPEVHFRILFPYGLDGDNPKSAELLKEDQERYRRLQKILQIGKG